MKSVAAAAFALCLLVRATQAQDTQCWSLRAGVHPMQPKPDNHTAIDVSDGAAVTFSVTYMIDRHWGIEALAALPVTHDIAINDAGKVARFDTEARLDGVSLGTIELDPYAVGMFIGTRLR